MNLQLFVHNSYESLYNYVPRQLLPMEYGGDGGTLESIINSWEKRIVSYKSYYNEEKNYGVDEGKRSDGRNKTSSIFGVDGSFRQLTID